MTRRHHRRPQAFTLIELLVVIGIIAVLVTLVTFGVKSLGDSQKEKSTRVTMNNLKNFVAEKQVTGGAQQLDQVYGGLPLPAPAKFPKDFDAQSDRFPKWDNNGVPQNATAATQAVMQLLRAVPNVSTWMSQLPTNQVWTPMPPDVANNAPRIPLVLDAWGNPIIYVPPGGLTGVTVTGGGGGEKSRFADTIPDQPAGRSPQVAVQSPDQKGFWASAGPDGFFTDPNPGPPAQREPFGDDNIYSFE